MISELSALVYATFGLICAGALYFFVRLIFQPLAGKTRVVWTIGVGMGIWLCAQMILAYRGFYLASFELPPRMLVAIVPWILLYIGLFAFLWRGHYLQKLSLKTMTHIHVFRLPLELIVFTGLASAGYIPNVMTLHETNFDILAGLTAPLIGYLYFTRKNLSWKGLLVWNIVSLLLLVNITFTAVLSFPYPFQQFGFEQPNVAILHFPFILLPTLLVPIAYFCHLASIHHLLYCRERRVNSCQRELTMGNQ